MADHSKEGFLQFVRRIGAFLTYKFSNLHLDSRSFGALAAISFATIFIWGVLRAPSASLRRKPKRQTPNPITPHVGGHELTSASASGVRNLSEDYRVQNVVDEFFQPSTLTFSQFVRQRLSDGRKVTCRMLDIILEERSPEELQKQATKKVLTALEDAGLFTSGGLVKDKVLFCSTENGRTSFVRQLEPDWHIDSNPEIVTQLSRFIKYQLHISSAKLERPPSNVFTSNSLEQFFGCVV